MNSQSHRRNFNAARGCLVAVAEIGPVYIRTPIQKFQRNSTQSRSWANQHNQESKKKMISKTMCACLLPLVASVAAAQASAPQQEMGKLHIAVQMANDAYLNRLCLSIELQDWTEKKVCYPKLSAFPHFPVAAEVDITDAKNEGALISADLPVGRYVVKSYWVTNSRSRVYYYPKWNFFVPFSIEKDKDTYLGAWTAHATSTSKSWIGVNYSLGSFLVLEDQFKRDELLISGPAQTASAGSRRVDNKSPDPLSLKHPLLLPASVLVSGGSSSPSEVAAPAPIDTEVLAALIRGVGASGNRYESLPSATEVIVRQPASQIVIKEEILEAARRFVEDFQLNDRSLMIDRTVANPLKDDAGSWGSYAGDAAQLVSVPLNGIVATREVAYSRSFFNNTVPDVRSPSLQATEYLLFGGLIPIAKVASAGSGVHELVEHLSVNGRLADPVFSVEWSLLAQGGFGLTDQPNRAWLRRETRKMECAWFPLPHVGTELFRLGEQLRLNCRQYSRSAGNPDSVWSLASEMIYAFSKDKRIFVLEKRREPANPTKVMQVVVYLVE